MAPAWNDLGDQFKDSTKVVIGDVDCTSDGGKELCAANGVKGYPTVKFMGAGGGSYEDYSVRRRETETETEGERQRQTDRQRETETETGSVSGRVRQVHGCGRRLLRGLLGALSQTQKQTHSLSLPLSLTLSMCKATLTLCKATL